MATKRRPVKTLSRTQLEREVVKLRAGNAELRAGNVELRRALAKATLLIEKLTRRVDELEAKLRQTSRNSNKPPSSDPPEAPPRRKKKKSGRKRGGQPGHEGKARALIPTEETDKVVDCKPDACDGCGVDLVGEDRPAEIARLRALGAATREEREDHTVMADPEGNTFCVLDPERG